MVWCDGGLNVWQQEVMQAGVRAKKWNHETGKQEPLECPDVCLSKHGHLVRACPAKNQSNLLNDGDNVVISNNLSDGRDEITDRSDVVVNIEPDKAGPSQSAPGVPGSRVAKGKTDDSLPELVVNRAEDALLENTGSDVGVSNLPADESVTEENRHLNVDFNNDLQITVRNECDAIEMEMEQTEFKVPFKRKNVDEAQVGRPAKKPDRDELSDNDEAESGSESSDSSVSLSQSVFSGCRYEVDDIKLYLRATKNKRGVRIKEYFPDVKQFVEKARRFMMEGSFTNKEVYRLKTIVSEEVNGKISRPLTLGELHRALQGMDLGKAPGIDGLPVDFYKSFWSVIGEDLLEVLNDSLAGGLMPLSCRRAVLTLLPKRGDLTNIKCWRPVSLLCGDYKLFSKVLANRLAEVMDQVIHPDQTYCVPDQEKAFDRVEHVYLWRVLEAFGFCKKFINQVKVLYSDVESILKAGRSFSLRGGGMRPTQTDLIVNGLQSLMGMPQVLWNTFLLTSVFEGTAGRARAGGLPKRRVYGGVTGKQPADRLTIESSPGGHQTCAEPRQ
ncbi:pol-like protein [Triplophysa rosa]|uniref:Pol-like protein n=1 Tax=Triplophysa rosa TaxID=992332 RepID=A0A9W7WLS3_TRIRA|nr:pol-like protein [Triplophysa rosa]